MRRSRQLFLTLAIVGGSLAATTIALAFFVGVGSGTATASVGALDAPTNVQTSTTAGGSPVHVSWNAVTPPTGTLTGYYVQRYAGTTASPACGSSPQSLTATTSCNDTNVADGTYTYVVTAVFRSWTAPSAPSGAVAVVSDTTAPVGNIAFPVASGIYTASVWNSGCAGAICGTASDTGGLAVVAVSVRQGSGNYWNGSSFASASEVLNPAVGTTTWTLAFPASNFPAAGSYTTRVVVTDNAGNTTPLTRAFTYDNTAPITTDNTATIGNGWKNTTQTVTLTPTDTGAGVAHTYYTTNGSSPTTSSADGTSIVLSAEGNYTVKYFSVDNAGNAEVVKTASTTIRIDKTVPSTSVSLSTPSNAYLNGTTLYYKGNSAGSFQFVNGVTDTLSGPASTTYPAIGTTNWTHNSETVTTPTGGPYTSSTFSWTSGAANPSGYTVTGTDAAGNATGTAVTFVNDSAAPTITTVVAPTGSATPGFIRQGSQYYVYANVTDGGSGVTSGTANVTNVTTGSSAVAMVAGTYSLGATNYNYRSAALTANGSLSEGSKQFLVKATDNVGNIYSGANNGSVTVDNTGPATTITFPIANGTYNATSWAAGCSPAGVCGSAADTNGIASVSGTIQRGSDSKFWNGTAWQSGSFILTATGTTSWNLALNASALTQTTYTVTATSTDNAGNTSTTASSAFTYDTTAPSVTAALSNGGGSSKVTVAGTAGSATGDAATVTVNICTSASYASHANTCAAGWAAFTTSTGVSSGNYGVTSGNIGNGTYFASVTQSDAAGNLGTVTTGPFVR